MGAEIKKQEPLRQKGIVSTAKKIVSGVVRQVVDSIAHSGDAVRPIDQGKVRHIHAVKRKSLPPIPGIFLGSL